MTVPRRAIRARLQHTLSRYWDEGPAVLRSAATATGTLCEPGFLVTLKAANRRGLAGVQAEVEKVAKATRAAKVRQVHGRGAKQGAAQNNSEAKPAAGTDATLSSAGEWLKVQENLTRALCRRFHRAAAVNHAAARKSEAGEAVEPPVPLHEDAEVALAYQRVWPEDLPSTLANLSLDRMEVKYLRMEHRAWPKNLTDHYRSQLRSCQVRFIQDGLWVDGLGPADAAGNRLSVDVFITRPTTKGMKFVDEEQELTIEILAIRAATSLPSAVASEAAGDEVPQGQDER